MNGNANGKGKLKRMEMVFHGTSYQFTLNPHQYDLKIPNRVNLVYTKGGAFIDLFGEGVKELSISGTTGYKGSSGDPDQGYRQFLALKKIITDSMNAIEEGAPVDEDDLLRFYNHTDGEAFMTVPIKMNLLRNVNEPLLFKYDLSFYVIQRVGDPRRGEEAQRLAVSTPTSRSRKGDFLKEQASSMVTALPTDFETAVDDELDRQGGGFVNKVRSLMQQAEKVGRQQQKGSSAKGSAYYTVDDEGRTKEAYQW